MCVWPHRNVDNGLGVTVPDVDIGSTMNAWDFISPLKLLLKKLNFYVPCTDKQNNCYICNKILCIIYFFLITFYYKIIDGKYLHLLGYPDFYNIASSVFPLGYHEWCDEREGKEAHHNLLYSTIYDLESQLCISNFRKQLSQIWMSKDWQIWDFPFELSENLYGISAIKKISINLASGIMWKFLHLGF